MGLLCPRKGALPKTFFFCELFRKISSFPQTFLAAEKLISSQCIVWIMPLLSIQRLSVMEVI